MSRENERPELKAVGHADRADRARRGPEVGPGGQGEIPRRVLLAGDGRAAPLLAPALERRGLVVDVRPPLVALLAFREYDAIVLRNDVGPAGECLAIVEVLREEGCVAPVVVLDGIERSDECVRALAAGADDYAGLSRGVPELVVRIARPAEQADRYLPVRVQLGPLVLDRANRRVLEGERDVGCTPMEYALFDRVVASEGRVVSRGDLLDHCWCDMWELRSNIVATTVSRLRFRMERDDLVVPIRGVGYRLGSRYCPPEPAVLAHAS